MFHTPKNYVIAKKNKKKHIKPISFTPTVMLTEKKSTYYYADEHAASREADIRAQNTRFKAGHSD